MDTDKVMPNTKTEPVAEPISIVKCRELLGDEADALSDDEILVVARHAEALAHLVIALACRTVAPTSRRGETTNLAGVQ